MLRRVLAQTGSLFFGQMKVTVWQVFRTGAGDVWEDGIAGATGATAAIGAAGVAGVFGMRGLTGVGATFGVTGVFGVSTIAAFAEHPPVVKLMTAVSAQATHLLLYS